VFQVKICGITRWEDARAAIDAGADALGFNFFPGSPRYVAAAEARRIARRAPRRVACVGVFVNERAAAIEAVAREVGLDIVQLHGEESPAEVTRLARRRPVIKVFRVRRGFQPSRLAKYRDAAAYLLDSFAGSARGGTGRRFDWTIAARATAFGPVVLAGGLTPENVAEAIARVRPAAVDVCSGVESRPGQKDPARLRALLRAVERVRGDFE
jgi:phosphoribosylanthranilate isomerase